MGFLDFITGDQPPLVKQAFNDVKRMLRNGHEMFAAGTARLFDNEVLDVNLNALDEEINQCEQDLRRVVLEHLNVDPNRELIFSLKLISIVHEAERIGDLGKSLAKIADLANHQRMGPLVEPLRDLRTRILKMFDLARDGFIAGDEALARELIREHAQIKETITRYIHDLSQNKTISANEAVVYAMGARMLSRVSSHLANIASTVACPFDQIRRSPTWADSEKHLS